MSIDKANIFKLSNQELKKYCKNPFMDCFESTKAFAEALKSDIDTKETPQVLLLSAEYGMGKTFFSTRFTQYLKNNDYDVIYFSVWENDYFQEPFTAFSKEIIGYINNKFKAKKYKASIDNLFATIENVVGAFSMTIPESGISVSAKDLIKAFQQKNDPIIELRINLSSFISKTKSKKLIIIVDELDRCRPDYAMKTLECIKHFFDIEGLFIIIPTNVNALNDCTTSLYGINNLQSGAVIGKPKECYFQKFFNDTRKLKVPTLEDYIYIVKQILTKTALQQAVDKEYLSFDEQKYNSFQNLVRYFSEYSHKAGLTIRELSNFSQELIRICNNFYEPIRTQWLTCILAYKNKRLNNQDFFYYPLPLEHCFYSDNTYSRSRPTGKEKLFKAETYFTIFNQLQNVNTVYYDSNGYFDTINDLKHETPSINSYNEFSKFLTEKSEQIKILENKYTNHNICSHNLKLIETAIQEQKEEIKKYQYTYGSDDNDAKRRDIYLQIVNNPETLYSFSNE